MPGNKKTLIRITKNHIQPKKLIDKNTLQTFDEI
jgi:hypothetical protein